MNKPIILIDSDQVIVQFTQEWLRRYNNKYEDNLTREEFGQSFGGVHDVVKPECGKKVYDITKEEGFFQSLKPIEGAVEAVTNLMGIADVYIVTAYANDPNSALGKVEWYTKHFPKIVEEERLILCKPKFLMYGDVLIDDSVENLEKWQAFMQDQVGKDDSYSICFADVHNEDVQDNSLIDVRVHDWAETLDYLKATVL